MTWSRTSIGDVNRRARSGSAPSTRSSCSAFPDINRSLTKAPPALAALAARATGAWGVLIGPEGGFSSTERARIRAHPAAVPVSLGPRILRADTAAIAALTLWQAALGDLKGA